MLEKGGDVRRTSKNKKIQDMYKNPDILAIRRSRILRWLVNLKGREEKMSP